MRTTLVSVTLVMSCVVACKKAPEERGTGVPVDVAGVNALVPATLQGKLVFEQQSLATKLGETTTTFTAAWPKGWNRSDVERSALAVAPDSLDIGMSIQLGLNCGGMCEPRDWAKVTEEYVAPLLASGKVTKDVKGKANRLVIAEQGGVTIVYFAWWKDGASQTYTCEAELHGEVAATLAPAFEKVCQAIGVSVVEPSH